MAINTDLITQYEEISAKSALSSTDAKYAAMKSGFPSVCGSTSTVSNNEKNKSKSPYLAGEKVQLLSRVTEKRFTRKRATKFESSFPFAANIYKASSDDFNKPIKCANNNKPKKSVLTLPKTPSLMPQDYTVSDMTESEYFNNKFDNSKQKTKRLPPKKKSKQINKDFMFYDRDAKYFSQLNIDLYSSSTDVGNEFDDDRRMKMNKNDKISNHELNDVWSVLRSINQFQFKPSPPVSDTSISVQKKKRKATNKRRRKDIRVIESCCQEEISYCSILDVERKTPSIETLISEDRITVINENNISNKYLNANKYPIKLLINSNKENPNIPKKEKKLTKKKSKPQSIKAGKSSGNKANNERRVTKIGTKPAATGYEKGDFFEVQFTDSDDDENGSGHNEEIENSIKPQLVSTKVGPEDGEESLWLLRENISYEPKTKCPASSSEISQRQKNAKDSKKLVKKSHVKVTLKSAVESKKQLNDLISDLLQKGDATLGAKKIRQFGKEKERVEPFTTINTQHPFKTSYIDVRRYMHQLKFPIVVQNAEEVSSTLLITNEQPCQFDGLDKQVWPFMTKWYPWKKFKHTTDRDSRMSPVSQGKPLDKQRNHIQRAPQLNASKPLQQVKPIQRIIRDSNKEFISSLVGSKKSNEKLLPSKKNSFKDIMLKLLNKDGSRNQINTVTKYDSCKSMKETRTNEEKPLYVVTENNMSLDRFRQDKSLIDNLPESVNNNKPKRRWSKAKWASDFIENVVKKVKNGVYYTQETMSKNIQSESKHKLLTETTNLSKFQGEVPQSKSINTDTDAKTVKDKSTGIEIQKDNDHLNNLFGIDDLLTGLEVKTLNMNQIAVKHRVTNVVVQFDVCLPTKNGAITKSDKSINSIMEPVQPESATKVLKFKTSIFNDILPAAICSLIPKIMKDILRNDGNGSIPLLVQQSNAYLSTISETSSIDVIKPKLLVENNNIKDVSFPCEIYEPLTKYVDKIHSEVVIPQLTETTSRLLNVNRGRIPKRNIKNNVANTTTLMKKIFTISKSYRDLLPNLSGSSTVYFMNLPPPITFRNGYNFDESKTTLKQPANTEKINSNTVQPYVSTALNSRSQLSSQCYFNYNNIMKNMVEYLGKQNISKWGITIITPGSQLNVYVDVMSRDAILDKDYICLKLNYETIVNPDIEIKDVTPKMITFENLQENKVIEKPTQTARTASISKFRGKGLRLCKKGKSTSNLSSEKTTTPLNRITTIEDFLVILGWNKTLISVFDGTSGQKIMDSIQEIKKFTKEISSRQALLIMLLANKKESTNLIKFKPIILQAIAVNRITRTNELDMEIEVIEREHFCIPSEFEAFSRTGKTSENKLLEELYWIAKTTASDYQKSFDESSEKLLKDLLHKRKKLNQSYLRVMARYVGLGLLKAPAKLR